VQPTISREIKLSDYQPTCSNINPPCWRLWRRFWFQWLPFYLAGRVGRCDCLLLGGVFHI